MRLNEKHFMAAAGRLDKSTNNDESENFAFYMGLPEARSGRGSSDSTSPASLTKIAKLDVSALPLPAADGESSGRKDKSNKNNPPGTNPICLPTGALLVRAVCSTHTMLVS